MRVLPLLLLAGLAAPALADPALMSREGLSGEGMGALEIGMDEADAIKALGPVSVSAPGEDLSCYILTPKGGAGLYLMIEQGHLTRITAALGASVATDKSIKLGSSEKDVYAAYPDVRSDGGFIDDGQPWQDLYYQPQGRDGLGLRFTLDRQGRVSAIHAGGPAIEYREGCPET